MLHFVYVKFKTAMQLCNSHSVRGYRGDQDTASSLKNILG